MKPGYYWASTVSADDPRIVVRIDERGQAWYGSTEFHASHFWDYDGPIIDPHEPRKDGE